MRTYFIVSLLFAGLLFIPASVLFAQQLQADPFAPAPAAADPFGPARVADPFAPARAADPFAPKFVPEQPDEFLPPVDHFAPALPAFVILDNNPFRKKPPTIRDYSVSIVTGLSYYSAGQTETPRYAVGSERLLTEMVKYVMWAQHVAQPVPEKYGFEVLDNDLAADALKKMTPAARLEYFLDRSITLNFNQNKLEDLAEALESKFPINVISDKKALEEAAFDTATPIDWLNQRPIKLRAALRMLLASLSLRYITDEGTLIITTATAAENRLIVRTYPIDPELLKVRKRLRPASFYQFGGRGYSGLFNLNQGGAGWVPMTGSMGMGGGGIPPLHADYEELDSLVDLITGIIQPVTWKTNGGQGDIIPNLQLGLLVVSTTEAVHEELAALLDVFKKKMAERMPPPSSPDAVERAVHAVVLPAVRLKQQNALDHNRPISKEPAFTMEQLVEQIKQQIEPASWANPKHTITTLGQNMIIEQTRANHLKINSFLKQLGITREQVEDERLFAEEQEQIRRDLAFRQEQDRERMEKERVKAQEDQKRKQEEDKRKQEDERRKQEEEKRKNEEERLKKQDEEEKKRKNLFPGA